MLKFDKIKIVTCLNDIAITEEGSFVKTIEHDKVVTYKYHQERPFLLDIKLDYQENEAVIEFTGKVLGERYPELITLANIKDCFKAINDLGYCRIDIDATLEHAEVVKCDVTSDIDCDDVPALCTYMRSHVVNYNQYRCTQLKNGNLVIEKNVTTNKYRKRMVVYDKSKEMRRADNKAFVDEHNLCGAFDNKVRFEVNLNSKSQICKSLGIDNTSLLAVLSSTANPIYAFVTQAIEDKAEDVHYSNFKEYCSALVLRDCDYDLAKVEARLRGLYGPGRSIPKMMEKYRVLLDNNGGSKGRNLFQAAINQLGNVLN